MMTMIIIIIIIIPLSSLLFSLKRKDTILMSGPGSSVGIATDYGLDGPVSNPGGDEIFRPSSLL